MTEAGRAYGPEAANGAVDRSRTLLGGKAALWAAAVFVALRVAAAFAVFLAARGAEVSSDARFYLYMAEHPFAVLTGDNLTALGGDVAVLSSYGPFLGPALGVPMALARRFVPDFFAVRGALAAWEALGLAAAYAAARRLLRGRTEAHAFRSQFLILAAALPLGWISTAAWPQDEIVLAPFIFLAFAAAVTDRPAAAAWALGLGALCAKYYALAFMPVAWLTCGRRGRFLLWAAAAAAPAVAWGAYLKLVHGVVPVLGYDVGVSAPFTISLFSLVEYGAGWLGAGTPGWFGVAAKLALPAALAAVAAKYYLAGRPAASGGIGEALHLWAAYGAVFLLCNAMGQPEYLTWFAYLAPFALAVVLPGRRLAAAAASLTALAFVGWVWNAAAAVANASLLPAGSARAAFAREATAVFGDAGVRALTFAAAVLYLGGLAYVAVAALRRAGPAACDFGGLGAVGLRTERE